MTEIKGSTSTATNTNSLNKEWDEASCPICMDHPHNAVLLLCSSHEKGCRSYICDTSYRHSNCLDRFKKLRTDIPQPSPSMVANSDTGSLGEGQGPPQAPTLEPLPASNSSESNLLNCPLCRGSVLGWMIVEEARQYLDMKPRSCSRESCSFSGTYGELRRHARRVHPATRPGDVDPLRQRAWRRLEQRREYGDIVSAIRSAMPGAIVLGDYVIDNADGSEGPPEPGEGGGPWWTTYFLFQMISSPVRSLDESRSTARTWRRHRRSSSGHRNLWGENLRGLRDDDRGGDEDAPPPRTRRRFMRSRRDDEGRP